MIKTILGPPGCGKTHTNTLLIRQCIEDGIYPERIACVSFTKKAAQERGRKKPFTLLSNITLYGFSSRSI
jgi:superfamily I DNA/RNA helicase